MKKSRNIHRVISQILVAFFVYFSLDVLFTFFRGNNVNVPESLLDSAIFCVIYFAINFWLLRNKKTETAEENTTDPK